MKKFLDLPGPLKRSIGIFNARNSDGRSRTTVMQVSNVTGRKLMSFTREEFEGQRSMSEISELTEDDFASVSAGILALERSDPNCELLRALKSSSDLSKYKLSMQDRLHELERGMLSTFLGNSETLLTMYRETSLCDSILGSMEETLENFGSNLRGVSDDIRQLQSKSEELSSRLRSRVETQEKLLSFIEGSVLSPDLVSVIFDEPDCSSVRFLMAVEQLGRKIALHATLPPDLPAIVDSSAEFPKLRNAANGRIREFLIAKFNKIKEDTKSPSVPASLHGGLLACGKLMQFLKNSEPVYFEEMIGYYVSVTSKLYCSQMKAYVHNTLAKLPLESTATKMDLLGSLEAPTGSNVFSLAGGRDLVIKEDLDSNPIISRGPKCYWEMLLRSEQKFLVEMSTLEFAFLKEFLNTENSPYFELVLGKTLTWLTDHVVSTQVQNSFDPIGLLLSTRVIEFMQDLMINKRKIPTLDAFFEGLLGHVRARLLVALDLNTESLRKLDLKKISSIPSNCPFFITRRYAEFLGAVLSVKAQLNEDRKLDLAMDKLTGAFDAFLDALGKGNFEPFEQEVFAINNVDLIVSVLGKHALYGDKLAGLMAGLVEQKLRQHFGPLIKFTLDQESSPSLSSKLVVSEMERLVITFQGNWKNEIDQIRNELVPLFSNLQMGKEILKNTMTQLLLYYTRFLKFVSGINASWTRQVVPAGVIMQQIKQVQNEAFAL